MPPQLAYLRDESLSFEEYHAFLKRTDLGSQYPEERLRERLERLLANRSLSITARSEDGALVGVAFGLTDFAYFLLLTDLGVDRSLVKSGIGSELLRRLVEAAGGENDISLVTVSNDEAYGFYRKAGLQNDRGLFWKPCQQWTRHTIR